MHKRRQKLLLCMTGYNNRVSSAMYADKLCITIVIKASCCLLKQCSPKRAAKTVLAAASCCCSPHEGFSALLLARMLHDTSLSL